MTASRRRVLPFLLLLAAAGSAAWASDRDEARARLLEQDPAKGVAQFSDLASASDDPELIGEYAYALWGAGLSELAFAQLDRAALEDAANAPFLYFAETLLSSAGMTDAAAELARPAPDWLAGKGAALRPAADARSLRSFDEEFSAALLLLEAGRYYSAAYRFHRLSQTAPEKPLVWAGYSIALEKIGAFKAAAKAAGRDAALSADLDASTRKLLEDRRSELESRGPVAAPRANAGLRGRFLCFLGGNFTQDPAETNWSLNARAGKFLSDRVDAAVFLGLLERRTDDSRDGPEFGLSLRYQQPLPLEQPLSATLAGRVSHAPAADRDRTGVIVSPGLSYFTEGGSVDLYLDLPLTGPLKDAKTVSLGYTAYFGGPSR